MNKSLSEIAHDITVSLLPKSLEEMNLTIWNDTDEDNLTYNSYEFVEEYVELHAEILKFLKIQYGDDGEDYPR